MSEHYNNIQPKQGVPDSCKILEQIPENIDLSGFQFSTGNVVESLPQSLASENVVRWFEQGGGDNLSIEQKSSSKSKQRLPASPDHVKHRRTRSGCYTCRARRVKCDEARPICCRKGSRECTWPPDSANKSSASHKSATQVEQDTDSSGVDDEEQNLTYRDETSKETATSLAGRLGLPNLKTTTRKQNRVAGEIFRNADRTKDKSTSPSTTEDTRQDSELLSLQGYQSTTSTNVSHDDLLWSRLKQDHQFYLNYHRQSLSYCYYFLKQDTCHFIDTTLIDTALTYEPLLYAIVSFAAFHYALTYPGKQISSFLVYYNKGVSLLRQDLFHGKPLTDAMIYTILQLATFEEYMGDWANLMVHQKAACEIIRKLYTPETMMQTSASRALFGWYIRFDIFVGFMAGSEALIGYEWFQALYDKTKALTVSDPTNIGYKLESLHAENRIIGMNMATLFAKLPKGEIGIEDFLEKNKVLLQSIDRWTANVRSLRSNVDHLVYNFPNERPLTWEDIGNPFEPGTLFDQTLFAANYMMMDCLAMEIMHKMQTSTVLQLLAPPEMTDLALQQCQVFEAMQEYEGAPPGCYLPAQVNLGLLCLFVPRDEKHISWCRKWLVKFENTGYIYPPSFRTKIAENWLMPELKNSWLVDDSKQPQIVKDLRRFVQERTTKPQTQLSEDIRSMKAVLEKLSLDESPKNSPESMNSASEAVISPIVRGSTNHSWNDNQSPSWPRPQSGLAYDNGHSHESRR